MNHLNWVIHWFAAHGAAEAAIKEHLDENFFDLGYIDSFAFITLMSDIEDEFGVSFDNDRFQDRAFSTIRGLAKALAEEAEK
ncbi:hypothetical protein BCS37_02345 [Selenomonas sp. oral taxon 920]|uniref:acyl carrier protein n=1 Tax=Selenomonas sp. oral taxon 920 TaxID=1884263 RepID=UPI000840B011|nr:acyl carrier protein [Selenomonas sp. oral taxon 920]AOH47352.1 hypothetical protein BCS37_02345 [Selenomonas sp. oral taxon 920]